MQGLVAGLVEGRTVLDLACGTGFYSRLFKGLGASRVVGVDISEAMVAAARDEEGRAKAAIDYVVQDAVTLPILGRFDVAPRCTCFTMPRLRTS